MRAVHWHGIVGSQLQLPVFDPVLRLLAVGRVSKLFSVAVGRVLEKNSSLVFTHLSKTYMSVDWLRETECVLCDELLSLTSVPGTHYNPRATKQAN